MHIFEFHTALKPHQHGEQFVMDCPFCEKEGHFFYNKDTFLWDCKVCAKSGNATTFIREIYNHFSTLTQANTFLAPLRELPLSAVSHFKPKYNPLNGSYLLPTYKHGKINNLYKIDLLKKQNKVTGVWEEKWRVIASPSPLEHTLLNWDETTEDTIWVCEGQWDRMAAHCIIGSNGISAIGTPGAAVWKPSWCEVLAEKDVVFCYHNDTSGRTGYQNIIIKHIAASPFKPKSISFMDWPADKPEKYDLNDVYIEYGKGSFNVIKDWIKPYTTPEGLVVVKTTIETVEADKSCTSYELLIERYQSVYHTTHPMKQALLLVLSSIYSTKIEGEQLWIRLIGAPSSGKTTIAKSVSGSEQVVLKSTFTGLFSGWREAGAAAGATGDASLIPLISNKTLIVKDADTLLKQKNVEQIFSELRDFYDKDSSTFYRHGVSHDYRNIRSTMILCGTMALRRSDQSFLGERFVDFELELSEADRMHIEERMLSRSMSTAMDPSKLPPETPVIAAGKGFIEHLMERPMLTQIGAMEQYNILTWARIAAMLRTKVDRELFGAKEITFDPVVEVSARLIGQLTKLYMCACVVLDIPKPNDTVHNLVAKVVRDIIDYKSARMKVVNCIRNVAMGGEEIRKETQLSNERIQREIEDLLALNLIVAQKHPSAAGVGRHVLKFKLCDALTKGLEHLG
jgi:hypothetical protein